MLIVTAKIRLYAPWVHSLKQKRTVRAGLVAQIRAKFNVSVAEVEAQDLHQTIVLGIAGVAANTAQANSILDHVLAFIERRSEAEIVAVEREIL